LSIKCGNLDVSQPSGLSRPVIRIALSFLWALSSNRRLSLAMPGIGMGSIGTPEKEQTTTQEWRYDETNGQRGVFEEDVENHERWTREGRNT
jgi:hypothetical protein